MLSTQKLHRLTDYAMDLQYATDYDHASALALSAMDDLIPSDGSALTLATLIYPVKREHHSRQSKAWQYMSEAAYAFDQDDPVYQSRLRRTLERPSHYSEFTDDATFTRTALYNEVWRPHGIRRQMAYFNPGRLSVACTVRRTSCVDFTDADVTAMHLIARHLDGTLENLAHRNAGKLPVRNQLEPLQRFYWIVCDMADGSILRSDPHALTMLRTCLGAEASTRAVPPEWLMQARQRLAGQPGQPLSFRRNGRLISAYIAPIRSCTGEFSVSFVEDPMPEDPTAPLRALGLTDRESEVMRWLIEGKTNPEIGIILGISTLTAKKHVENVLHKLGVETRTAAVTRGLDALRTTPLRV